MTGMFLAGGAQVFLNIMIFLLSIGAVVFLVFRIMNERKRVEELKNLDGAVRKKSMERFLETKIMRSTSDEKFSLAKINLENHESLLEKYGVEQYDKIFSKIRTRLKGVMTQGSKLGQYEHSFVIFMKEGFGEAELAKMGKYIVETCSKPILFAGAVLITPEINVSLCSFPESGDSVETLLASLNLALIVAKRSGVNNHIVHTTKLGSTETAEYKHFMEIKTGIEKKQFLLYYQPIVDLQTLEVSGVEALLRWKHPTQGIMSPKDFLEMIETSGDIYLLGLWTFEQMLEQQKQWRISYPDRDFYCSVNLSLKQLMHAALSDDIRRIVKKFAKIKPEEICFEVSEQALNFKDEVLANNLRFLTDMGFLIAIDNYGDADTSIKALKNTSAKVIKLSRSFFLQSLTSGITKNIIEMLVNFGNENGIKIVAEGIEDAEMLERAQGFGLTYAQGYHFSRPVSAAECMSGIVMTPWKDGSVLRGDIRDSAGARLAIDTVASAATAVEAAKAIEALSKSVVGENTAEVEEPPVEEEPSAPVQTEEKPTPAEPEIPAKAEAKTKTATTAKKPAEAKATTKTAPAKPKNNANGQKMAKNGEKTKE